MGKRLDVYSWKANYINIYPVLFTINSESEIAKYEQGVLYNNCKKNYFMQCVCLPSANFPHVCPTIPLPAPSLCIPQDMNQWYK